MSQRMGIMATVLLGLCLQACAAAAAAEAQSTHRLYHGITAYVDNPGGAEFTVNPLLHQASQSGQMARGCPGANQIKGGAIKANDKYSHESIRSICGFRTN